MQWWRPITVLSSHTLPCYRGLCTVHFGGRRWFPCLLSNKLPCILMTEVTPSLIACGHQNRTAGALQLRFRT